ncbi:MAG: ATP-binding protein [Armatimonadota bacterium]
MYKPRKLLKPIDKFLKKGEILVIHGARQTGKTTLLKIIRDKLINEKGVLPDNIFYFDLEDFTFLEMFNKGHKEVVSYIESHKNIDKNNKIYILIDEIQYLDNPSPLLKILHDHYEWLKIIVSGSSSFQVKSKFKDSLAGRTVDFELYPLDFEEFLVFKEINYDLSSFKAFQSETVNKELSGLFKEYLIYGGYPKIVLEKSIDAKETYLKQVINTYVKKDIRDLGHIRDVNRFNKLLRVLADKTGSLLNVLELSSTIGISRPTIEEYLFIMENTYIIKMVPPFYTNIRSEISKMSKIFFEDTGIANLLKYGVFLDKVSGELFENAVYCAIRSALGKEIVKYWRTKQKTEIDFIADLNFKKIPAEAKLSYPQKSLSTLISFIDKYKQKDAWVISLQKLSSGEDERIKSLYPWEIFAAAQDIKKHTA